MDRPSLMNTHGLEDGSIPAHKPCFFAASCERKGPACPVDGMLYSEPFLCIVARLKSFAAEIREAGEGADPNETFYPDREVK